MNSHQNTRQFLINEDIAQIEKVQKYSCLRVLSQVFKQNLATQKSCSTKPHNTHQFLKKQPSERKDFLTGSTYQWLPAWPCKETDLLKFPFFLHSMLACYKSKYLFGNL